MGAIPRWRIHSRGHPPSPSRAFQIVLPTTPLSFSSPPMSSSSARKIVYAPGRNQVADDFYTVLLSNVRSAAPDLPMDPVVFRALLLCILASGGKNLLLRSYDEDISLIQNITALVSCYLLPPRPPRINPIDRSGNHLLIIIHLGSVQSVWVPDTESQNQIEAFAF